MMPRVYFLIFVEDKAEPLVFYRALSAGEMLHACWDQACNGVQGAGDSTERTTDATCEMNSPGQPKTQKYLPAENRLDFPP